MSEILVTGAAGFIGYHVCERLLADGRHVVGLDNLNPYYDPRLKEARLAMLMDDPKFAFTKLDLADAVGIEQLFAEHSFDSVVHLAAQAGVRYSVTNPQAYISSNVVGFFHILEGCRHQAVGHLVFASSSSVYGASTRMPFSVHDHADHPISLYAATKKSNEMMAHSYAALYGLPCTGLRLFTVYGPWGRPDMALFKFTRAILEGGPVELYNYGLQRRDFTYVGDVVECVTRILRVAPRPDVEWNGVVPDPASSRSPYRLYNVGSHHPVELMEVIRLLEAELGRRADLRLQPMQPGDVPETYADVSDLRAAIGYVPDTPIADGIHRFVDWYCEYYEPVALAG